MQLFTGDWQTYARKGPIEVIMGLGAGVVCGLVVGYIPHKCEVWPNLYFIIPCFVTRYLF